MATWAAVVLAAGMGTRMKSTTPKVLHRVCGKEMVRYVVDAVRHVHAGLLVVVVPPNADAIRAALGDGVEYMVQPAPGGTGQAVLTTEQAVRGRADHVLVLNGDTPLLLPSTLSRLMQQHEASGAWATLLTSDTVPAGGLGRIVRDGAGGIVDIVEQAQATEAQRAIAEVNGGVYAFEAHWLWPALREVRPSRTGEHYLTGLVSLAARAGGRIAGVASTQPLEALGVDTRVRLAQAEAAMRQRLLEHWMLEGVTLLDPATTYIDATVTLGQDTIVYPNTWLSGATRIGARCQIGPGTHIANSVVGDDCKVVSSVVEDATLEDHVDMGPFSHLRPGAYIERDVHIGNYAEVKNSRIGQRTQMGHFSYVGDAVVGADVNIGAGAITCNYDGVAKHQTIIGDGAFIGSDTMLVAPVRVGARSATGAGSVVTKDIPPDSLAVGVPARILRPRFPSGRPPA